MLTEFVFNVTYKDKTKEQITVKLHEDGSENYRDAWVKLARQMTLDKEVKRVSLIIER